MKHIKDRFRQLEDIYPKNEASSIFYICMTTLLGCTKAELLCMRDITLSEEQSCRLDQMLKRLMNHEPIQHITGQSEFYGSHFCVTKDTLIPRPETEELADWIITDWSGKECSALDIGTGSGCIAITLAKNMKKAEVTAIDISEEALIVAKENAKANSCHINFAQLDILDRQKRDEAGAFDIIVSNPPYIREAEKEDMQRNVLDYEPATALFVPDNDPLLFYREIAEFGKTHLKNNGKLYFEINQAFGNETVELLSNLGYEEIILRKDMFGKDRMIRATHK